MAVSSSATSSTDTSRIVVPAEYFVYVREAEKDGNLLYRCLKCLIHIYMLILMPKLFYICITLQRALLEKRYRRMTPSFPGGYVTLNTGLPSSASVERLFSLGGRIFTPLLSRMTSEHFEMMMFLHMAHHFHCRGVGRWD